MLLTPLSPEDRLHLSCSREGGCCHGHQVAISPWELARLAQGRQLSRREFRDRYTDCGGARLLFDQAPSAADAPGWRGKSSCSQYWPGAGCSVHAFRPLACRLYPLGRERHEGRIRYYHLGERLSCFELCPSVAYMPKLSVADYLAGQQVSAGTAAHDGYAALAYGMVKAATVIAAELTPPQRAQLRQSFAGFSKLSAPQLAAAIPARWLDRLVIPDVTEPLDDPAAFVAAHGRQLSAALQTDFADPARYYEAAELYALLALQLGGTVGTDPLVMADMLKEAA